MLKNNNKISLLLLTYALAMLFIFILAIVPTLKLRKEYKNYKIIYHEILESNNLKENLGSELIKYKQQWNSVVNENFHEELHEFISKYCFENNITLVDFPEPIISDEEFMRKETHMVILQSSYKKLLKFLHTLEKNSSYSDIRCVEFFLKENYRNKSTKLLLKVYIQNNTLINENI